MSATSLTSAKNNEQEKKIKNLKNYQESAENPVNHEDMVTEQIKLTKSEQILDQTVNSLTQQREWLIQTDETLTQRLLAGSLTEKTLSKVLEDPQFAELWEKPDERMKNLLLKINTAMSEFVYHKYGVEKWKRPSFDKIIQNTILPAGEWYLLELLQKQGNEKNTSALKAADKIKFDWFSTLLSGMTNLFSSEEESFNTFSGLVKWIDFLILHQDEIQKNYDQGFISDILENPYLFLDKYLKNPVWKSKKTLTTLNMVELGIKFEKSGGYNWMSQQQENEIKEKIGIIDLKNNPETVAMMLELTQKIQNLSSKQPKLQKEALYMLTKIDEGMSVLWDDLVENMLNDQWLSRVLDMACSLIGFAWGLDGLKKVFYARKIENEIKDDKKEQIKDIYQYVQKSTIDNSRSTQGISKTSLVFLTWKTIPAESQKYFNIDSQILNAGFMDKADLNQINPMAVMALWKESKDFMKTEIVKNDEWEEKTEYVLDIEKLSKKENKEKFFSSYQKMMAENLAKNEPFLKMLDEHKDKTEDAPQDRVLLAMVSGLFVKPNTVVNGITANAFLPSQMLWDMPQIEEKKIEKSELSKEKEWFQWIFDVVKRAQTQITSSYSPEMSLSYFYAVYIHGWKEAAKHKNDYKTWSKNVLKSMWKSELEVEVQWKTMKIKDIPTQNIAEYIARYQNVHRYEELTKEGAVKWFASSK